MWRIEKKFCFEASHQLPKHSGKCKRLHGHSWVGSLICESPTLQETGPETGMLLDFSRLKAVVQPLLENHLDHWHLNESLKLEDPTAELIARWIFSRVKLEIPELVAVVIEETCTSKCEYRP